MKLTELLERISIDGYLEDVQTKEKLKSQQLLLKNEWPLKNDENDYEFRLIGEQYIAIAQVSGTVKYIETEQSRRKRSQNSCLCCGLDFSITEILEEGKELIGKKPVYNNLGAWVPQSPQSFLEVNHDCESHLCLKCQQEDPILARMLVNERIINALSQNRDRRDSWG